MGPQEGKDALSHLGSRMQLSLCTSVWTLERKIAGHLRLNNWRTVFILPTMPGLNQPRHSCTEFTK